MTVRRDLLAVCLIATLFASGCGGQLGQDLSRALAAADLGVIPGLAGMPVGNPPTDPFSTSLDASLMPTSTGLTSGLAGLAPSIPPPPGDSRISPRGGRSGSAVRMVAFDSSGSFWHPGLGPWLSRV